MTSSPIPFATLLAGLQDPNSQVRRQAITGIMRRRNERGQAFASLLALLGDPEDQVRKAAIKAKLDAEKREKQRKRKPASRASQGKD